VKITSILARLIFSVDILILHCAISSDVVEENSVFLGNVNFCKNCHFLEKNSVSAELNFAREYV